MAESIGQQRQRQGKKIADCDAMSVRVTPKCKKYTGKQLRLDLDSYPNISLKEVRTVSDRLRAKLEKGYAPTTG